VIFGGQNDSIPGRILNDLVFLRINSWRWDPVRLHSENISGRVGASCTVLGSKVLIFGGMATTGFASTTIYELEVDQKKLMETFGLRRESVMSYLEYS
jgi:N-acetylneuraminic acid mutarotase